MNILRRKHQQDQHDKSPCADNGLSTFHVVLHLNDLRIDLRHYVDFCSMMYYILDACEFNGFPEVTLRKFRNELCAYDAVYLNRADEYLVQQLFEYGTRLPKDMKLLGECQKLLHSILIDTRTLADKLEHEQSVHDAAAPEKYDLKYSTHEFAMSFKKLVNACNDLLGLLDKCVDQKCRVLVSV